MVDSKPIERPSFSTAQQLPKTRQLTSYEPGDDGDLQKGFDVEPRFTDNGDGTITDNSTGLVWPQNWNGPGANNGNFLTWYEQVAWARALDFAGHTDWRIPNAIEHVSLYDYEIFGIGYGPPFKNIWGTYIFTSTTYRKTITYAVRINKGNGLLSITLKTALWIPIVVRG